jgi:hypothetical protein
MVRLLVALALVVTFFAGWVIGGQRRPSGADPAVVSRLEQQIATLQARLRVRDDLATRGTASPTNLAPASPSRAPVGGAGLAPGPYAGSSVAGTSRVDAGTSASTSAATAASDAARTTPAVTASVQGALDRFYRYLETAKGTGPERWRQSRQLVEELRAMGAPAGQALMHVLSMGADTDERRAAARLLGQLQVAEALPLLKDVVEREQDLLLRRAAASGLRQLQTPDSVPVMERLLAQPTEDRFVRLSAAAGLADSGRPLGVAGLARIFDEAAADGRGRDMAFRALARLEDERPLPFMRQVLTANVEPMYRLQAIRYVARHGDQQALASLHVLMHSPNEQPSIRDAAAQAHAALSGR